MIDLKDIYWLAGLLEGEGSFQATPANVSRGYGRVYPRVQLTMTDEDVVRHAAAVVGVGHVHGPYVDKRPQNTPVWAWRVGKQADAAALMMMLYPLMGIRRREQIRFALTKWYGQAEPDSAPRHRMAARRNGIRWCGPCDLPADECQRLVQAA